jgi:hypothetical protein
VTCTYVAAAALINLVAGNSIGKNKAVESGGFEVLLAAVNNNLDSAFFCEQVCWALKAIVAGSKDKKNAIDKFGWCHRYGQSQNQVAG